MALARLPTRLPIAEGESFISFARRLAILNDVAVKHVLGSDRYLSRKRPPPKMLARVADLSGVDQSRLANSTMQGCSEIVLYCKSRWRLRTTVWECRRCTSRGIADRDRGFAIAFACVRCGTLLESSTSGFGQEDQPTEVDPSLIELQRELSAAFHETATRPAAAERLDRLSDGANELGRALVQRAKDATTDATQWPAVEAITHWERASDRWARGALGLPELPSLFAEVFKAGWDIAASPYLHHLMQVGLGGSPKIRAPHWLPGLGSGSRDSNLDAMRVSRSVAAIEIGVRMRELINRRGLRSIHIPNEIRYQDDPMVLDDSTWSWRRHICSALRHWLLRLEGDIPDPEWQGRGYFDSTRDADSSYVLRGGVMRNEATTFANQILELAESLVRAGLTEQHDVRSGIPAHVLDQMVPAAARRPGTTDLADLWMWLDEVVGTDAYARLPAYEVADLVQFDEELGPEGRLSLREYRTQSAAEDAELVTSSKVGHSRTRGETA